MILGRYGSQANILNNIGAYWFVSSYSIQANVNVGIDYGTNFYAYICTRNSSIYVGQADSDNALLVGPESQEKFCFHFTRVNSNNGYVIRSFYDDKVLDVDGAHDANGTNVQFYPYHDHPAQVWYFQDRGGWTSITAGCTDKVLDAYMGGTTKGTNLQMWEWNGGSGQQYNIWKIGDNKKVGKNYGENVYAMIKNSSTKKPIGYADSGNVELMSEKTDNYDKTIWHFTRLNSLNAYRISTLDGNSYMDVDGASSAEGTNVQCWRYNDNPAQEWYLQTRAGSLAMTAGCTSKYLFLSKKQTSDGTNVVLGTFGNDNAFKIDLDIISSDNLVDYNITANKEKVSRGESVTLSIGGDLPYVYNYSFRILQPDGSTDLVDNHCNNRLEYTPKLQGEYTVYASIRNPYNTESFEYNNTGFVTGKCVTFTADFDSFSDGGFDYSVNEDGTLCIEKYTGTARDLVIPSTVNGKTVTSVACGAFSGCNTLVKVTFPDTITKNNGTIFSNCENLKTVILPRGITGYSTLFYNCDSIEEVEFPDSVTALYGYSFFDCNNLSTLIIPSSVTYIARGGQGSLLYSIEKNKITIYGTPGSTAEEYANTMSGYGYDVTFKDIKDRPEPTEPTEPTEPSTQPPTQVPVYLGDADGNGEVDMADATIIQRHATMIAVPYDEAQLMHADIDGDGSLSIVDATFIQRYDTHMKVPYPIGETI